MRTIRFAVFALLAAFPLLTRAQDAHVLQLNLQGDVPTIITGAVGGGTYSLPAGGGVLATTSGGVLVVPDIVDMMGAYNGASNYKKYDLVSSTTPDILPANLCAGRKVSGPRGLGRPPEQRG